jgi:glycosyltransferase involved in cell wall biosynthesis
MLNTIAVERIFCISKAVAEPFKHYPKKVRVIYNAIDPDKYLCSDKDRSLIRSELGIRPDSFVVGYVGQIAKWKGVDLLVQAAKEVLKTAANVKFLFVGDVFYEGRKGELFKDDLIKKTKEWNISDKIMFIGQRKDIPKILSAIDVLAVPSADPEPFSLALIEGMAAGKTVIASSHGGPAEIIRDKVDGRLVEPRDPKNMAKILLELINNKELVIEIGANARERVKADFSLEKHRHAHSVLLNEILLS